MGGIEGEAAFCSWSTGRPAEPRRAGDGCQRPLVPRSRFQPRLTPSVRRKHIAAEPLNIEALGESHVRRNPDPRSQG